MRVVGPFWSFKSKMFDILLDFQVNPEKLNEKNDGVISLTSILACES